MSRRPSNSTRRPVGGGISGSIFHPKSRPSPLLSVVLGALGVVLVVSYLFSGSSSRSGTGTGTGTGSRKEAIAAVYGDTCSMELQRTLPTLKKTYGERMQKVLHVGPDSCSVVSKLLKGEEIEAWGVEPYDIEDVGRHCHNLVRRGLVRVADIKFPLPYRDNSFSLVMVSDAVDYLSPKYLNKTLPDLARMSSNGVVIFTGVPGHSRSKVAELSKFGRPAKMRSATWWANFFVQTSLVENDVAAKKFEEATKNSYIPRCQVFHIKSFN